jgi:hypothetical protein
MTTPEDVRQAAENTVKAAENLKASATAVGTAAGTAIQELERVRQALERVTKELSLPVNGPSVNAETPGFWSQLVQVAQASVLIGALLFVIGSAFLDSYYFEFGLQMSEVGVSLPTASLFALRVLFANLWNWVVFSLLVTLFIVLSQDSVRGRVGRFHVALRVTLLAGLIVAGTYGAWRWGAYAGAQSARYDMVHPSTLPTIAWAIEKTVAKSVSLPTQAVKACPPGDTSDCKLLLAANDRYYLFRPLKGRSNYGVEVVTIPATGVVLKRLSQPIIPD